MRPGALVAQETKMGKWQWEMDEISLITAKVSWNQDIYTNTCLKSCSQAAKDLMMPSEWYREALMQEEVYP